MISDKRWWVDTMMLGNVGVMCMSELCSKHQYKYPSFCVYYDFRDSITVTSKQNLKYRSVSIPRKYSLAINDVLSASVESEVVCFRHVKQ